MGFRHHHHLSLEDKLDLMLDILVKIAGRENVIEYYEGEILSGLSDLKTAINNNADATAEAVQAVEDAAERVLAKLADIPNDTSEIEADIRAITQNTDALKQAAAQAKQIATDTPEPEEEPAPEEDEGSDEGEVEGDEGDDTEDGDEA